MPRSERFTASPSKIPRDATAAPRPTPSSADETVAEFEIIRNRSGTAQSFLGDTRRSLPDIRPPIGLQFRWIWNRRKGLLSMSFTRKPVNDFNDLTAILWNF